MKRTVSMILCVVLVALMLPVFPLSVAAEAEAVTPDTSWYSDDATEFILTTPAQLLGFAKLMKTDGKNFDGKTVKLGADIDLNPGYTGTEDEDAPANVWPNGGKFSGVFDGQGHSISGVYMKTTVAFDGMFGSTGASASGKVTVKNVGILNSYIETAQSEFGGLFGRVGDGDCLIESVYSSATIVSRWTKRDNGRVGGFIGYVTGGKSAEIRNSVFNGKINIPTGIQMNGGLVGATWAANAITVKDCAVYGSLTTNDNRIGGVIGNLNTNNPTTVTITNCVVFIRVEGASWAADAKWQGSLIGVIENTAVSATATNCVYSDVFYSGSAHDLTCGSGSAGGTAVLTVTGSKYVPFSDQKQWLANPAADLAALGMEGWNIEKGIPVPASVAQYVPVEVPQTPDNVDVSWYFGHENDAEYTLADGADLLGLAWLISQGVNFASKTVKLANDIDVNPGYVGDETAPANTWFDASDMGFAGILDGQGHTISGVYNNFGGGLFGGKGTDGASVRDLTIARSYLKASKAGFGVLFGNTSGTVSVQNVTVEADVKMVFTAAAKPARIGLIGNANGTLTLTNCSFKGSISATEDARAVGGMVGYVDTNGNVSITNCSVSGTIVTGGNQVGGFVGYFGDGAGLVIDHCVFTGSLTPASWVKDAHWIGALVGRTDGAEAGKVQLKNSVYGSISQGDDVVLNNPCGTGDSWTTGNFTATNLTYVDAPAIIGSQIKENADSKDIRFVGYVNSLEYNAVGMKIKIVVGGEEKTIDSGRITKVYESIIGGDQTYTAKSELLGVEGYLYGYAITGIPKDAVVTFEVTPYYIVEGTTIVECTTVTVSYN